MSKDQQQQQNEPVVEEDGGAQFQSYLNNDGIDDLTPQSRKHITFIIRFKQLAKWFN